MHKLLERQLKRHIGSVDRIPEEWEDFIAAVDEAYQQADGDRAELEHSMDQASQELLERNEQLQQQMAAEQARMQLLEEQSQVLLDAVQTVALGNLDAKVEIPEGSEVLSELAVGMNTMIDDLREMLAEQDRAKADAEEARKQMEVALEEVLAAQRRYTRQEWSDYIPTKTSRGYFLSEDEEGVTEEAWLPAMATAVRKTATTTEGDEQGATLAVPIRLYGETIGVLGFSRGEGEPWSDDEIAAVEAIIEQVGLALENQRLFDERTQRTEELTTLNMIASTVSRSLEMQDLLETALDVTIAALGYDAGLISLYDDDAGKLCLGSHRNLPVAMVGKLEQEGLADTLCDVVFQTGKVLGIGDIREGAPVDVSDLVKHGLRAYVGSPVLYQDRILGTFCLFSRSVRDLGTAKVSLLEAIGQQIGIGIQNARLFEQTQTALAETEAQAQRLTLLNQMSEQLGRAASLEEVLNVSAARISQIFASHRSSVTLLTDQGDQFQVLALQGEEGAIPTGAQALVEGTAIGQVLNENRLIITSDTRTSNFPDLIGLSQRGILSTMNAPLVAGERKIGTLNVGNHRLNAYTERDGNLLLQVASLLSSAIENRRLFEQIQTALTETGEQAHRLALLSDMSEKLGRATTLNEILNISASKVTEIFAADRTSVAMLSATGDSFEIFALRGAEGATPVGSHLEAKGTEMEQAVRERRLIIVDDAPRENLGSIRSFMVAPLIAGGQPIGTLNVASKQPHAYTQRDGNLFLQTAAFLSSAIENRRLFEQTQAALEEVEATHRRYLERQWAEYLITTRTAGYETGQPDIEPLGDAVLAEIERAMERQGATVLTGDGGEGEGRSALVAPVALRGAVIGALGIHAEERRWSPEEIALVEAIAERMALAAENLRLLDETQRRATREQLTREITDKMRGAKDMDELMQIAIQEMATTLGTPSAFVQLSTPPSSAEGGREDTQIGGRPRRGDTTPLPNIWAEDEQPEQDRSEKDE